MNRIKHNIGVDMGRNSSRLANILLEGRLLVLEAIAITSSCPC